MRDVAAIADDELRGLPNNIAALEYGNTYEFRARLVDVSGAGPTVEDNARNGGAAPVASQHFRRYIRPKAVQVQALPGGFQFEISRPPMGYPEAVFTGFPDAVATLLSRKQALLTDDDSDTKLAFVPDPDADFIEIRVLVEGQNFDLAARDDRYTEVYRTSRRMPPLSDMDAPAPALIEILPIDCARLSDVAWEDSKAPIGSIDGAVRVPSGRKLKIEVRALCRKDANYFGNEQARLGDAVDLWDKPHKYPVGQEGQVFPPAGQGVELTSVFLQPEPPASAVTDSKIAFSGPTSMMIRRLASALDLHTDDGVLHGRKGHKTIFGCAGLRHHLSPDQGALTLSSARELEQRWVNCLNLSINRDWTYKAFAITAFRLERRLDAPAAGIDSLETVIRIQPEQAVNDWALRGSIDRESVDLILVDAFQPPLDDRGFPHEFMVAYKLTAFFENGEIEVIETSTRLPITYPPKVTPHILSAGLAFSEYQITADYEETIPRQASLWLEVSEPSEKDPRDVLFARLTAEAPDPLLMPSYEPVIDSPPPSGLEIDPEYARVIRPGQPDDAAGLSAMQPLVPGPTSKDGRSRYYALPIPAHLTSGSPELHGFFTYEFRYGHPASTPSHPMWSTAQGRFGPSMMLDGIQHPKPPLLCTVQRGEDALFLSAPFAFAVYKDREQFRDPPSTGMWFAVYARVMQTDGTGFRNIQIALIEGVPADRQHNQPPFALAKLPFIDFEDQLAAIGGDTKTPLGVIAIETLPEPNSVLDQPLQQDLGYVRVMRTSTLTVPSLGIFCGATCGVYGNQGRSSHNPHIS
ncbi:MAG: hypothetical protein AAFY56_19055, partial [Pseudomonadota bacterium]